MKTEIPYPIKKILLPYDGSPGAKNALELAAHLAVAGREAVQQVTLLRVIGGGYLARHFHNVDLRVTRMDQVQEWQRIRQRYLDQEIMPLLEEGKQILEGLGVTVPIERRVAEGKVHEEIIGLAREEAFSAIVMGRRGLSPLKALLLGSVTRGVLSLAEAVTVYVAGQEAPPRVGCPLSPLLLPVDGSEYSLAAVRQAAALARAVRDQGPRLLLLHVIDEAVLGITISSGTETLVAEAERILAESRGPLEEAGLAGLWEEKLVTGNPAQVILQEADAGGFAGIMMGSKGRSALEKLLMGSVTSTVMQTASRPAVAVVYA
jgi:nucleotide-binding universal stress UspA family protein